MENLFLMLVLLFAADGVLSHLIVSKGGKEVGLVSRWIIGKYPSGRALISYTIVKAGLFGLFMMLTENATLLHQGLVFGAGLIVAWNSYQLGLALKEK